MQLINVTNDILLEKTDYLCHQVNCQGVMGAGLALQIRNALPEVYWAYRRQYELTCCNGAEALQSLLGYAQVVPLKNQSYSVVNLFAQFDYGKGNNHTNKSAMKTAILSLCKEIAFREQDDGNQASVVVSVPYGMGCGLAGGDWGEIAPLIVAAFQEGETKYHLNLTLKICKKA